MDEKLNVKFVDLIKLKGQTITNVIPDSWKRTPVIKINKLKNDILKVFKLANAKRVPQGRGMYIWVLSRTENGNLDTIIKKCKRCNIRWVAIKAGDQGSTGWMPTRQGKPQFSADIVSKLHDAGIMVYGWSYDSPRHHTDKDGKMLDRGDILAKQARIIQKVADAGADGFIIDAEAEWNRAKDPDAEARNYLAEIAKLKLPAYFAIGDAPWASIQYHPKFPTTEFGKGVDFRCPQALWVLKTDKDKTVPGPVDDMCNTYATMWDRYQKWAATDRKPPAPESVKPHVTGGSLFNQGDKVVKPFEVNYFEDFMRKRGSPGVIYWVWEKVPQDIWDAMADGTIPPYESRE